MGVVAVGAGEVGGWTQVDQPLTNHARPRKFFFPEGPAMPIVVSIGVAKARLSELVARAEAGEDVVIARDNSPVARLSRMPRECDIRAAIAEIRAAREGLAPVSDDEILAWRDEGRRF